MTQHVRLAPWRQLLAPIGADGRVIREWRCFVTLEMTDNTIRALEKASFQTRYDGVMIGVMFPGLAKRLGCWGTVVTRWRAPVHVAAGTTVTFDWHTPVARCD
jgi:hypothetical protein